MLQNKYIDDYKDKLIVKLIKEKVDNNLINSNNLNYDNDINILPSYLSKGLEFDAVIITDKTTFNVDSELDMKLLYVSMTRALHKLVIKELN